MDKEMININANLLKEPTFGETQSAFELSPEGTGYRVKTRFSKFYNLPELISMFKEVADIQTADMLNLPVPEAHFKVIKTETSEEQKEMLKSLSERADKVRKSTQLLFSDMSTPKGDGSFNIYDDIRDKLGKMTKVKFVESKNQIDNEISKLEEKIKLSSNETEVVTDNELTRELMEKYVESVICTTWNYKCNMTIESLDQTYLPRFIEFFKEFLEREPKWGCFVTAPFVSPVFPL